MRLCCSRSVRLVGHCTHQQINSTSAFREKLVLPGVVGLQIGERHHCKCWISMSQHSHCSIKANMAANINSFKSFIESICFLLLYLTFWINFTHTQALSFLSPKSLSPQSLFPKAAFPEPFYHKSISVVIGLDLLSNGTLCCFKKPITQSLWQVFGQFIIVAKRKQAAVVMFTDLNAGYGKHCLCLCAWASNIRRHKSALIRIFVSKRAFEWITNCTNEDKKCKEISCWAFIL